jgi:hypothetical protein
MDAISIPLARSDVRQVGVPGERVDLVERHLAFLPILVKETKLDSLGNLAEEGEVRACAVE